MDTIASKKSLPKLALHMGFGSTTFDERVKFFHDLLSIELESGHDVDVEAIGVSRQQVESWMKQYPTELEAAKERCREGILAHPHCGF